MKIVGFQKFSTVDYPGYICAVVFLGGCNMNCGFCHNLDTAVKKSEQRVDTDTILHFLEKRKHLLDAVCISGGEPTLYGDELVAFIAEIKRMGYKLKLYTNGSRPEVVDTLLENQLLDYVAMDVKAPWDRYEEICRCPVNVDNIRATIELINNSGIRYEYRTTYIPSLFVGDIKKIASSIKGARKYVLQQFRIEDGANDAREHYGMPHGKDYIMNTVSEIRDLFGAVDIRGI